MSRSLHCNLYPVWRACVARFPDSAAIEQVVWEPN
ncbi:hypothetical protein BH18GEM1_BH18GEM1_09350 [soil metagenome]